MDAGARAGAARLRRPAPVSTDGALRLARVIPWSICLITAVAAALRFAQLSAVAPDPFYDAAVRSMGSSLPNLFFGAFDPGGALGIDKPPVDLWLQVASVKLLGWSRVSLQLPEALAGTAAVPLLYDAVRPVAGRAAALASAAALALLPASVLTARSDTMDGVMMLLLVAALWLTVRALQPGRERALVLAGAAVGLAFEVKLMEALLVVLPLAVLFWLGSDLVRARRVREIARAAATGVAVGLAWPVLVTLAPGHHPWSVGSSDGSIWNAMFVFNGFGKVSSAVPGKPGGPGPVRLFEANGWHYDILFGCVLLGALALGGAALASGRRRGAPRGEWALAAAVTVWVGLGLLVFDVMRTVHARYLDAFAPAVALAIGCGAAALAGLYGRTPETPLGRRRLISGGVAMLAITIYTFRFRPASVGLSVAMLLFAAAGAALLVRSGGRWAPRARWLLAGLLAAVALVFPAHESLRLIRDHADDSAGLGTLDGGSIQALARVPGLGAGEVAVDEPLGLAPLIVRDLQPILPLTSFAGRPLIGLSALRSAIAAGRVRFGLVARVRCLPADRRAACLPAARWIRSTGTPVTVPGLSGRERLYRLGPHR